MSATFSRGKLALIFLSCVLAVTGGTTNAHEKVNRDAEAGDRGGLDGQRYRVIVSTDIGGTDPDDFQSMVHLLVYADCPGYRRSDFVAVRAWTKAAYSRRHRVLRERLPQPEDVLGDVPNSRRNCERSQSRAKRSPLPTRACEIRPKARGGSSSAHVAMTRVRCMCWSGEGSKIWRRPSTMLLTSCRSSVSTTSAVRTRSGGRMRTSTSPITIRRSGSSRPTRPIAAGSTAVISRASGATRSS